VGQLLFIAWLAFYNLSLIFLDFLHKRSTFLKVFDKNGGFVCFLDSVKKLKYWPCGVVGAFYFFS
jgi:hypothetical protein